MLGNLQGKSLEDEFMPLSCTELSKSLIEYARTHLNETEETRKKRIQEVKEFLKTEYNLDIEFPDILYLCYLRSRKFDVKKTCTLVKRTIDFIHSYTSLFDRDDSDAVRRTVHSKILGFLPYRDAKGRAIFYCRSELWNPRELKADEIIFGSIVSLHVASENPVNQVAGFVVILDFKNLAVQQIVAISHWLLFGLQALQQCCPCLIKEFHILHTPALFRATWKITKPLISEKIRKRIIFYKSSHWHNLHRRISPRILPAELGGQLGPFSNEHWAGDITEIEKKYRDRLNLFLSRLKRD